MSGVKLGKRRLDLTLEPVSAKAIPVHAGEVMRISQIEGAQCVDFNCFNLHDYKEYMSVGHMRREGFRTEVGRFIWSAPPRFRPMMKIVDMSPSCITDLQGARCCGVQFEDQYGLNDQPNCQDTLAEAIHEFGLTPDDTHDALSLWKNTNWDHVGTNVNWNCGKARDHIDILAMMDVLAVPAICGEGDLWITSNFSFKPIQIQVFQKSKTSAALAQSEWKAACNLKTQRKLKDFRNRTIRTDPELKPDTKYQPDFVNYPIVWKDIEVTFTSEELQRIWPYRGKLGNTDEEVVRTMFFHWYLDNKKKKHGIRGHALTHA
jgi:uncharacterized protein YcgI (DUF1989 family)